ncbi:MAG: GNAT family N-acetyltransferase [Haloarculaceae archaeon]
MTVRPAQSADRPAIRDVARRSLQASYSLGPQAITGAVEEWYGEERLAATLADEDRLLLVHEEDGQVVGFSESEISGEGVGTILWLHVDPAYRGEGIGSELFEATRERLWGLGAVHLQGRVLEDNAEGNEFYRERGFERIGQGEIEIAGRTHLEHRYVEADGDERDQIETPDGNRVYVDRYATERGSIAPFLVVYLDESSEDRYGFYCSNCGTLANAMDSMGRIECDACGNARKPTRWDAAYL